eukprot:m.58401 g.58401  ORF g.58401 m.58401 type:complete len:285 (+) comp22542_c0_seq2:404-1258(+)
MSASRRVSTSYAVRMAMYPSTSSTCQLSSCARPLNKTCPPYKCSLCDAIFCMDHCGQRPISGKKFARLCETCNNNMKFPLSVGMQAAKLTKSEMIAKLAANPDTNKPDQYYVLAGATASEHEYASLYSHMSFQMLSQFCGYLEREEEQQEDQLNKWYDSKIKRLNALIDMKINPKTESANYSFGFGVSEASTHATPGAGSGSLSTPLHTSISRVCTDDDGVNPKEELHKNVDLLFDGKISREEFDESVSQLLELHLSPLMTMMRPSDHQWTTLGDVEFDDDEMV